MSEINVTPLVDVMLVLLIVFMVTSPMMIGGIELDLPKTEAGTLPEKDKPLILSINHEGKIYIFETQIPKMKLVNKLKEITKENKNSYIFLKGDKKVAYGLIAELVALIRSAGYNKVALISEISE